MGKLLDSDLIVVIQMLIVGILLMILIFLGSYINRWKDTSDKYFERGYFYKDFILKEKYEYMGKGTSIECLGGSYKQYKLRNNNSLNIKKEIFVCDK